MSQRLVGPLRAAVSKHLLSEIAIVTIGILIALSFDGLVEWRQERRLAREATATIRSEIAANKAQLDGRLKAVRDSRVHIEKTFKLVKLLLAERAQGVTDPDRVDTQGMVWFSIELTSTAMRTAETTGALRHMPYPEVSGYANLYELQAELVRLHGRLQDHFVLIGGMAKGRIKFRDLTTPELYAWRDHLMVAWEYLDTLERHAQRLSRNYGLTLKEAAPST